MTASSGAAGPVRQADVARAANDAPVEPAHGDQSIRLAFLSNAFVPVSTLPAWLRTVTKVNPVSHAVSAMRDVMNKGAITGDVEWALLGCAAVATIFIPLAVRSYTKHV